MTTTDKPTAFRPYFIPAPADRPRYQEYAAGAPGDYRPIAERFADKVMDEARTPGGCALAFDAPMHAALVRAFNAGRACEPSRRASSRSE